MSTPKHCPGFEQFKGLQSFTCKCPACGQEKEIFSDEFDRQHTCAKCSKQIDFAKCAIEGSAGTSTAR